MSHLIKVKELSKYFKDLKALNQISFEIAEGEILGLIGESGSGKSTLGKMILGLEKPTSGSIFFQNKDITSFSRPEWKNFRKQAQIIFQDPYASLNGRMIALDIISEPFKIHSLVPKNVIKQRVEELFLLVGLNPNDLYRYPHEFSGGQRQRIVIARALASNPQFLICDEPISALDVSIQAQVINLLKKLQKERRLTYLFIAHDLSIVKYLSTRVAVLYLGNLVELAPTASLYANPLHPYTETLLSAIPIPDPIKEKNRSRIVLKGDLPTARNPPKGCIFCAQCPKVQEICHRERPTWKEVKPGHFTACHLINN